MFGRDKPREGERARVRDRLPTVGVMTGFTVFVDEAGWQATLEVGAVALPEAVMEAAWAGSALCVRVSVCSEISVHTHTHTHTHAHSLTV